MTVSLRVKGWLTDKTISVPEDVVSALADLVADVRDLRAENARLAPMELALRVLVDAIGRSTENEAFNDAYRGAQAALRSS